MNWFIAVIFSMNLKIGKGFPIIENAPHLGMNDNEIIGNSISVISVGNERIFTFFEKINLSVICELFL